MRAFLLAVSRLALAGAFLFLTAGTGAQDAAQTRARLKELRAAIAELTESQRREERRRGQLQAKLRATEQELSTLQGKIRDTDASIRALQESIADLETRRSELHVSTEQQGYAIRAALRDAYKNGDRGHLRLLLSEEDPQVLARLMTSYRYVVEARGELIAEFRRTLADLDSVEADLNRRVADLEASRKRQKAQVASLEESRRERGRVLAQIDRNLADQGSALAARESERQQLEELLAEIEAKLAQMIPGEDVEPFTSAQGRMPWPVDGRITFGFGRPRAQGKMRWQGVRMQADAGEPVRAIHHGRVVYADWLRGSGLLLVIDHGEGYMSLYAHNESLLREVGDWVSTGTAVATVGDTGGQSEAGLYFEIRKDGRPTNPARWCSS
jgi:septal ring factor EnvC (AmiA/AmiB activator)